MLTWFHPCLENLTLSVRDTTAVTLATCCPRLKTLCLGSLISLAAHNVPDFESVAAEDEKQQSAIHALTQGSTCLASLSLYTRPLQASLPLDRVPFLSDLNIYEPFLTEPDSEKIGWATKLTSLYISDDTLSDSGLEQILAGCSRLDKLRLERTPLVTSLERCQSQSLRYLSIGDCSIEHLSLPGLLTIEQVKINPIHLRKLSTHLE